MSVDKREVLVWFVTETSLFDFMCVFMWKNVEKIDDWYTNTYQIFQSYASGTLIIRDTEDYAGNSVVIEISYYK